MAALNDKMLSLIKDNKYWIEKNDFDKVYENLWEDVDWTWDIKEITRFFTEDCGIEVLKYVTEVPTAYLYEYNKLCNVVIPNNVKAIHANAFAHCYNLKTVTIPSSVTEIHDLAFDGDINLIIKCEAGSYAEKWAYDKGIKVDYI